MKYLIKEKKDLMFVPLTAFSTNGSNLTNNKEAGFSIVEVSAAMVVILVALLGVFVTFTYTISYNAGNNSRAQALAVLQREVELMRSAKFTPILAVRDNYTPVDTNDNRRDIYGGIKAPRIVISADGNRFRVVTVIDNDPIAEGIQSGNEDTTRIKEISVTVTLDNPTPGWQTAIPATVVLQRVRAN